MSILGGPPLTVAAVVVFGAVATFALGVEPAMAAQLGTQLALPPHTVAHVLAIEFGASMIAALPALLWSERVAPRAVALSAGLLFIVANVLSACTPTYAMLLVARSLAGLASGTLLIVVLSTAARCASTERVYSAWVFGQTLASAGGLVGLPRLHASLGLTGAYGLMAIAMTAALTLLHGLSSVVDSRASRSATHLQEIRPAATALAVLFLFYVSVGGIWAFAAERGVAAEIRPQDAAVELGVAMLAGVAGVVLASVISRRGRSLRWALLGHATLAGALVLFATAHEDGRFVASAILLQFAWSFSAPFLLARVAACGPPGRMMSATNVVLGAGLTAGPLLMGVLIEQPGSYVLASGAALMLLSFGALLLVTGPQPAPQRISSS